MQRRLYTSPSSYIDIEIDDDTMRWQSRALIDHGLIEANHERGRDAGRAPLGDRHGAWYKEAEIPAAVFFARFPADAWEDEKAIARFLNDSDNRAWKCNGGRTI